MAGSSGNAARIITPAGFPPSSSGEGGNLVNFGNGLHVVSEIGKDGKLD
jgi:hypothetical protein